MNSTDDNVFKFIFISFVFLSGKIFYGRARELSQSEIQWNEIKLAMDGEKEYFLPLKW